MPARSTIASLSDHDLLEHVRSLTESERRITAELVASLAELDARRLYLAAGCSSLFTYCIQVLHLSEHAAYGRIAAARCARRFPEILDQLADGSLTLTAVTLLGPLLTARNVGVLISRARHKSRREVERVVAELRPAADVPTVVRKSPSPGATADLTYNLPVNVAAPTSADVAANASARGFEPLSGQPPVVLPGAPQREAAQALRMKPADVRSLSAETYKVQFTLSQDGYMRLRRAQDLLRHTIPSGNAALIFERALSVLVHDLEKKKLAATARPLAASASAKTETHGKAGAKANEISPLGAKANGKTNGKANAKTNTTTATSATNETNAKMNSKTNGKPTKATSKAKKRARYIAAHVKREVWKRDRGRCAFVGTHGRCRERGQLEYHHVIPFADGGATSAENLQLRCRAHNQHEAILWSGVDASPTRSEPSWHAIGGDAADLSLTPPHRRHPP
jgi:hypothetical protein